MPHGAACHGQRGGGCETFRDAEFGPPIKEEAPGLFILREMFAFAVIK